MRCFIIEIKEIYLSAGRPRHFLASSVLYPTWQLPIRKKQEWQSFTVARFSKRLPKLTNSNTELILQLLLGSKMRIQMKAMLGLCLASFPVERYAFTPTSAFSANRASTTIQRITTEILLSETNEDCGCGPTVFQGKPSEFAQTSINHRQVIGNLPIFKVDGTETSINGIIGETNENPNKTSLVVFMRSLGWPFCQEQIVQYNRIRQSELLANQVDLVIVSIGKPEIGKKLINHLEVEDGQNWIFCDPDNKLYDALQLNRGIETTFLSIETPYAFKDRFFGSNGRKDGMKDLLDVLGKWKDAVYIPPKQEQAFQRKIVHLNFHMCGLFCYFFS